MLCAQSSQSTIIMLSPKAVAQHKDQHLKIRPDRAPPLLGFAAATQYASRLQSRCLLLGKIAEALSGTARVLRASQTASAAGYSYRAWKQLGTRATARRSMICAKRSARTATARLYPVIQLSPTAHAVLEAAGWACASGPTAVRGSLRDRGRLAVGQKRKACDRSLRST